MNDPFTIHPTNSEPFEIGDKVTTIKLADDQPVIGDPCCGLGNKYIEYLLTHLLDRQLSPATEPSRKLGRTMTNRSPATAPADPPPCVPSPVPL
jgi:hypothetical protein